MKYIFLLLFIHSIVLSQGQSFIHYEDTLNQFSIDLPPGWSHAKPSYPSVKLVVYRTPLTKTDTSKDNLNVNIIKTPGLSLEKTYSRFVKSLRATDNFKLIDSGDAVIGGRNFKWLIETHKYESDNIQLHNYDFVTYQDDKTYILTLVTFSNRFELIEPTFKRIANSFILK